MFLNKALSVDYFCGRTLNSYEKRQGEKTEKWGEVKGEQNKINNKAGTGKKKEKEG